MGTDRNGRRSAIARQPRFWGSEFPILPNRQIVRRETAKIPQSELTALLNRFAQSLANPPEVGDRTIANLKQKQRQSYGIIHLATHAQFVAGEPERSFIQFADAPLTIADIPRLDWSDSQISLLVLSACETAVGDRQAELGFAGLALQAGIPSAIATLWQVSDLGTVALMGEFYRQLKADKSKAVALQRAQIALRSGRVALEGNQSPAGIAVDCAATGEPDGNDLPGFFPSLLLGGLFPDWKPLIGVPATCHSFL